MNTAEIEKEFLKVTVFIYIKNKFVVFIN